jgi:hypothetical protein
MKRQKVARLLAAALLAASSAVAQAGLVVLNPVSDGSLYVCQGCNTVVDGMYLMASGYIQGDVKFSSAALHGQHVQQAVLTVNPYGLPLWDKTVDVYGYGTSIAAQDVTDANAGTLLGTLLLPDNLGYGQDAQFDVTSFVAGLNAPYIAFNLRTDNGGTDVFSSLEHNYDHPAQLRVMTTVPEPGSLALMGLGLAALAPSLRRRARKGSIA